MNHKKYLFANKIVNDLNRLYTDTELSYGVPSVDNEDCEQATIADISQEPTDIINSYLKVLAYLS